VLIEGRLKLDTWETNDGQKRSKLRVVGEKMQMLGAPGGSRGGGGPSGGGRPAPRDEDEYSQPAASQEDYGHDDASGPGGDDIPF
jgi:single-strand DNA-binding protein